MLFQYKVLFFEVFASKFFATVVTVHPHFSTTADTRQIHVHWQWSFTRAWTVSSPSFACELVIDVANVVENFDFLPRRLYFFKLSRPSLTAYATQKLSSGKHWFNRCWFDSFVHLCLRLVRFIAEFNNSAHICTVWRRHFLFSERCSLFQIHVDYVRT